MKRVLLRGPLLTNSGYGVHSRQVFSWLIKRKDIDLKCQILPWGTNPWILSKKYSNNIIEKILERSIDEKNLLIQKYDETYQVQMPEEWIKLSKKDVGITAGIESNLCNTSVLNHINKMDLVIVPSNFSKKCLEDTAINNKIDLETNIDIVPESYPECFDNVSIDSIRKDLDIKTEFNFLVFGQITNLDFKKDRKNTFNTIKTLIEAFKENKDVGIILKTNIGKNNKLNKKQIKQILSEFLLKHNLQKEKRNCKLYIICENLSESELYNLYTDKKIKALVSGTRGEGFGLTHLESARLGLPIITTNWSGYKDFLEDDMISVNYTLENVNIDNSIFSKDSMWAKFDEEDMKEKLKLYYKKSDFYIKRSKKLKNKIKQKFCLDNIIKIYNSKVSD